MCGFMLAVFLAINLTGLEGRAENGIPGLEDVESGNERRDTVVLLHGLGRRKAAMWRLASRLEDAGYRVERVGYKSLKQSPEENLADISKQITACCLNSQSTLHFVGHSLGGLMIRAFLQDNDIERLGRVVLIGTPNQGSQIVDHFGEDWWMKLLGPTATKLGSGTEALPSLLSKPHYDVGVIAGVSRALSVNKFVSGDHDGLVAVETTKLTGMKDFVIVETNHSALLYNDEVAKQTIAFLKTGSFLHEAQLAPAPDDAEKPPRPDSIPSESSEVHRGGTFVE